MKKIWLKKIGVAVLYFVGFTLPLIQLLLAAGFQYDVELLNLGPANFMHRICVIYGEVGRFWYTNPAAMIFYFLYCFFLLGIIAVVSGVCFGWGVHKLKAFPKIKRFYKILATVSLTAFLVLVLSTGKYSASCTSWGKFWSKIEQCKTLSDFEKVVGKWVYHKLVAESDRELMQKIAIFNSKTNGFIEGRDLYIFRSDNISRCYILVWMEKEKLAAVNWSHQSATEKPAFFEKQ